jgi:nicotinate-nucleotide pyrophosphorylase (carboxylating)
MQESDFLPLIDLALLEDLGSLGDVTSKAITPDEQRTACLWSKDEGVLAGEAVFTAVFKRVDPRVKVEFNFHDGAALARGDTVATVRGRAQSLFSAERTAINFIGLLSGIATKSRRFASLAAAHGKAVILDTRKTIPGLRALSKYAVTVGGSRNHRQGLYDMALIKDNHIAAVGSISEAVRRVRAGDLRGRPIEVEVTSLELLAEALRLPVDRIMLDNMPLDVMREAVRMAGGRIPLEASGGVSLRTVRAIADTGVDYVSVGALTHSVNALDISLDIAH